jgi:hypothetical protein
VVVATGLPSGERWTLGQCIGRPVELPPKLKGLSEAFGGCYSLVVGSKLLAKGLVVGCSNSLVAVFSETKNPLPGYNNRRKNSANSELENATQTEPVTAGAFLLFLPESVEFGHARNLQQDPSSNYH